MNMESVCQDIASAVDANCNCPAALVNRTAMFRLPNYSIANQNGTDINLQTRKYTDTATHLLREWWINKTTDVCPASMIRSFIDLASHPSSFSLVEMPLLSSSRLVFLMRKQCRLRLSPKYTCRSPPLHIRTWHRVRTRHSAAFCRS
jgi:hypothetical protein